MATRLSGRQNAHGPIRQCQPRGIVKGTVPKQARLARHGVGKTCDVLLLADNTVIPLRVGDEVGDVANPVVGMLAGGVMEFSQPRHLVAGLVREGRLPGEREEGPGRETGRPPSPPMIIEVALLNGRRLAAPADIAPALLRRLVAAVGGA